MTISQAFQIAVQHHQAGRLAEAEGRYRQILAVQPKHGDALHLMGVIAHQVGRHDLAVEWIRNAIAVNPDGLQYYLSLGNVFAGQGDFAEAISAYRCAIQVKPDFSQAHTNLGNALKEQGEVDEAIVAYRRALQIEPGLPEAHHNLANALREQGQLDEAIAECRHALQVRPDFAEAHNSLGNALRDRGDLDEAVSAYRRATELRPDYARAHNNLGNALREQGQLEGAITACRRALELKPNTPEAHYNLGNALRDRSQVDEAMAAYRRALQLKPDFAEAWYNLGNVLKERNQIDEAVAAYLRAVKIKPDLVDAQYNLGNALLGQGHLDEAIATYHRALQVKPERSEAHNNLGNALRDQGNLDDAIAAFRRAVQFQPDSPSVHSNLVLTLHCHPKDNKTIPEEHERWSRQFSDPLKGIVLSHGNDRSPERRLRIGYVSPDFWDHVVGRNLMPLFERHDRQQFEILCYAGVAKTDAMTDRFRQSAQQWRNTVDVGDEALAEMIRRDGVDVLVDLSQHAAANRLPVFAHRPAPVQVSFAGYPDSTGLEAIGYRISDRHLEGESADERNGRKEHVCLIDSFWCYDPCGVEVEVNGLPARGSGRVTFGCLNNFCKVNDQMLSLWSRVLGKVTDSRLVLLSRAGSHRQRALEFLGNAGVEADRVEFVEYRPRREYLELYHRLDIVLDTAPYNGHTTSLDTLWMGVPVVSLAGKTPVSRAGLSQLTNLGLPELVAHSEKDYVRIAVELAGNLPRLAELRSTLRHRMETSVLMDAPRFARQVEQAYREMWQSWCSGESPIRKSI